MSNTFFIADLHYGHNNISQKFRTEFESDEAHNATIHDNIMSVANKRNDIYILGDIVFKTDYFSLVRQYIESFRNVHLVLGNHDHKSFAAYAIKHGAKVHGFIGKYNYWLSHCPIHPQEMYRAKGNIHGHLHTSRIAALPKMQGQQIVWGEDDRYLCVSCEQTNYKPVTLEMIREVFRSRGIE